MSLSSFVCEPARVERFNIKRQKGGWHKILSATSADGLGFSVDAGNRIDPESEIFDPMVLKTGNGWLLVSGPDGTYSATSSDGLTFPEAAPFTAGGRGFHAWAGTILPQSGYRLYGYFTDADAADKLTSVSFSDGTAWQADGVTCLTGEGAGPTVEAGFTTDVGIAVLSDGTFLMAYLAKRPE